MAFKADYRASYSYETLIVGLLSFAVEKASAQYLGEGYPCDTVSCGKRLREKRDLFLVKWLR